MPSTSRARVFFGSGEIDPRLFGRIDLPIFQSALTVCENFFPTPFGGLQYRDGLRLRLVLATQRNPRRMKIVRAPGFVGAVERMLILDGSSDSGRIEAYAFPFSGNTRFSRTNVWTASKNRIDPTSKSPVPLTIHEARVSSGDYAGTMFCHQDWAPMHLGNTAASAVESLTTRILLVIDAETSEIWQVNPELPGGSVKMARLPTAFSGVGGLAFHDGELLAICRAGGRTVLWLVNRSDPRLSVQIGALPEAMDNPTGLASHNGELMATNGLRGPAAGTEPTLWNVNRLNTERSEQRGTFPAEAMRPHGLTSYMTELLAIDQRRLWVVDPEDASQSTQVTGNVPTQISVDDDAHPNAFAAFGDKLFAAQFASDTHRARMWSVNRSNLGASTPVGGTPSAPEPADLPDQIRRPSGMTAVETTQQGFLLLGDLFDEKVNRSPNEGGSSAYFTPRNYVDQLGNDRGEGAHPRCSAVLHDRMIFAGSKYLPGSFIGSGLYPRPWVDLIGSDSSTALNDEDDLHSDLFDARHGLAVAQYGFYWLFFFPRRENNRGRVQETTAADSFRYKIASERELTILWTVPYNNYLVLGTTQGIWIARNLQPTDAPEITQFSNIAVGDVDPVITDFGIAFADAPRKEVHAASLGVGFEPPGRHNLMVHARHLTDGTQIRQLAWQKTPQRRLWMLTTDGRLQALCYEPESGVRGWFRVTNDRLRFCGICVIPTEESEVAVVAAHDADADQLATIYLCTLDGRDHLDLGIGVNTDFADDVLTSLLSDTTISTRTTITTTPRSREPDEPPPPPRTGVNCTLKVSISGASEVREGGSVTLTANPSGTQGNHPVKYSWSGDVSGTSRSVTFRAPQVNQRTTYRARVAITQEVDATERTLAGNCPATADHQISVTDIPKTLTVSISGSSQVRTRGQGLWRATVGGTATGAITYSWQLVRDSDGTVVDRSSGSSMSHVVGYLLAGSHPHTVRLRITRDGLSAFKTYSTTFYGLF